MASRVSVNVGVNDMTRTGLRSVDRSMRRLADRIRDTEPVVRVNLDEERTRAGIRRLNRAIHSLPDDVHVNVHLREPDRGAVTRFASGLRRRLMAPMRPITSTISGMLQDGIGQGIINGFRQSGPIGVAVLAAVLAGSAAVLGAAIAGALILGIGAGVVAMGVKLASESKKVQQSWEDASGRIKKAFEGAGDPLIGTIDKALEKLAKLAEDFAPHFKRAMEAAAPGIDDFLDHFDEGLRKMGKKAFDPIMSAFNTFMIAFGPKFEDFLEEFGESMGALARTVQNNSEEIAMALRAVLGIINLIIDTINFLANAWVFFIQSGIKLNAFLIDAFASIVDAAFSTFDSILSAAEKSMSWIPGLGEKITTAREMFDDFRFRTVESLRQSADAVRALGTTIQDQNQKNKLTADIRDIDAKVAAAKRQLQTVTDKKTRAKIEADIAQLLEKKRQALAALAAVNGTVAKTYIITYSSTVGSVAKFPGSSNGGGIPMRASGGIRGLSAAATGGVRSNMTLVGEQGPEIVNLAPGSTVRSNPDTRRMMSQAAGDGGGSTLVLQSSGRRADDLLLELLRESIHQRGGDVVRVLGG